MTKGGVKRDHPHLGATYKIIRRKDKSFVVQVSVPDAFPAIIMSFRVKADAEQWIERHKSEVANGAPQRPRFDSRQRT